MVPNSNQRAPAGGHEQHLSGPLPPSSNAQGLLRRLLCPLTLRPVAKAWHGRRSMYTASGFLVFLTGCFKRVVWWLLGQNVFDPSLVEYIPGLYCILWFFMVVLLFATKTIKVLFTSSAPNYLWRPSETRCPTIDQHDQGSVCVLKAHTPSIKGAADIIKMRPLVE